ncbi:MAG: insulinase family protein [Deltaproteobacteria bacterium]|nr:insulinase family protein [Deltaproteobacteria bacterium]
MAGNPFWSTKLENGLSLVFESIPRLGSTAVGFLVRTGSRDEPRNRAGMSHFLEHMCFKGTAGRSWDQINREVDDLGALWNAYTWWEGTAYFHWVQAERAEDSIDILADMMRPKLDEADFNMEKGVILEEIAMYNDNPSALIADRLIQAAFGDHPLGTSVLGTAETVTAVSHSDMTAYFRRRYTPNNMVFLATGAIERERLVETVRRHTATWTSGETGRSQSVPVFHSETRPAHRPEVAREHLALAWPGPEVGSPWAPAARVLARYLGEEENSRLYWSVKQKGLVDRVSASHVGFNDSGLMYVYASTAPARAGEVLGLIREEMARVHRRIDEAALSRSRIKAESALVREAEHGLSRWNQLAEIENAGAARKTVTQAMKDIEDVTVDRVRDFLDEFPLDGEPALVPLGPLERI